MSLNEVVIDGLLKSDGTLELDQKPSLRPGRVKVVLWQESEATQPPNEDWWQLMQNARKRMEEAGCHFMEDREMQSHIEWLREGDQIDDLLREMDVDGQKLEQP